MASIAEKCKQTLVAHYGNRLVGLVLFGSEARGEGDRESDVDLLVLLSSPVDYFRELRTIADVLYPVQLETDRLISAKPAQKDAFEGGTLQLYRNAKREGVRL